MAERNGWSQQTRLTDNTKLDPAYVEYLKAIYTLPHLKRRYIDGEFAAGEGLVHQYVPEVSTMRNRNQGDFAVCADAGASAVLPPLCTHGSNRIRRGSLPMNTITMRGRGRSSGTRNTRQPSCGATHGRRTYAWRMGANLRYEFTKLGVYCRTPVKDVEEVLGRLDSNFRRHSIVFQKGTCSNTLAEFATREWDSKARGARRKCTR